MTQSSPQKRSPAVVSDVMRPALTSVEQDAHVAAAAYLMKHAGATALVVLDDEPRQAADRPHHRGRRRPGRWPTART